MANAWEPYVTNMTGSGHVSQGAILGADGNVWAISKGLSLSDGERKAVVEGFRNADGLRAAGIHLGGKKYFCLQADQSQIQGKQAANGVSIAKGKTCILIGLYKEGQQPGNCRQTVEKMRDYLVDSGY